MKNRSVCLFVLSLVCLICLLTPSTMFAQEQGEPPCCYGPPTDQSVQGTSLDTQNLIILFDALIEITLSQTIGDATSTTTGIIVGDNQIPFMLPEDSFQLINSRRTEYLVI